MSDTPSPSAEASKTHSPTTDSPATAPAATTPVAMGQRLVMGLVALAVVLLVAYSGLGLMDAATPVPADAPEGVFSAERALTHVRALGTEPRPLGTAAHAHAVDYLQDQLRQLGVEPRLQEITLLASSPYRLPMAGQVRNVLARLPGSNPGGPAILVAAHYDSVQMAPGAADDLAGVAAMLETLRAVQSGDPLSHDVIFLFSDGEEVGLLGARAFVDHHPWAADVKVILNFEARGTSGASIMFRTNNGNGWIVRQMVAAAAPVASSLSHDVFKLMPNDTDFSQLRRLDAVGMDFAFIRGLPHYHTMLDNLDNLDAGSLQQHGDALLSMLRRLNGQSLDPLPASGDVSYFNLIGSAMIVYPISLVLPFAVLLLAVWITVLVMASRRGRVKMKAVFGGAFGFLLSVVVSVVVLVVVMQQFLRLDARFAWMNNGVSYDGEAYIWGLIALGLAVIGSLTLGLIRMVGALATSLGALLVWTLFALITAVLLPGASYLFLWPALLVLIGIALTLRWPEGLSWRNTAVIALALCPAMLIVPTIAFMIMEGLGLPLVPILCLLVLLLVGLAVQLLDLFPPKLVWALPALALVIALVQLIPNIGKDFSAEEPQPNMLLYALDADAGSARWASIDPAVSEWNEPYLGQPEGRQRLTDMLPFMFEFMQAEAPVFDLQPPRARLLLAGEGQDEGAPAAPEAEALEAAAPEAEISATETSATETSGTGSTEVTASEGDATEPDADKHIVRAELVSPRGGSQYFIGFESLAQVVAIRIGDQRFEFPSPRGGGGDFSWLMEAFGTLSEPLVIELELSDRHPVDLVVVDLSYGLPDAVAARPADTMPRPHLPFIDTTLVRARYLLAP